MEHVVTPVNVRYIYRGVKGGNGDVSGCGIDRNINPFSSGQPSATEENRKYLVPRECDPLTCFFPKDIKVNINKTYYVEHPIGGVGNCGECLLSEATGPKERICLLYHSMRHGRVGISADFGTLAVEAYHSQAVNREVKYNNILIPVLPSMALTREGFFLVLLCEYDSSLTSIVVFSILVEVTHYG